MDTTAPALRLALWQAASTPGDVDDNLRRLDVAAARAVDAGAEVLITPEMFVTGYSIGDRIGELARAQPLQRVAAIARDRGIAIVAGGPEQLVDGGVANAAWFIDDTGAVLARHRKIQLFGELDRAHFVAGDAAATTLVYRGFTLGIVICFDVEYPETVRAAAQRGAEILLVPTAQMHPFGFVNRHMIRTRAYENGVCIAYVNQHGPDGEFIYVGHSVLASAAGEHLLEAAETGEALLIGRVDRAAITRARALNPYLAEVRSALFAPPAARSTP